MTENQKINLKHTVILTLISGIIIFVLFNTLINVNDFIAVLKYGELRLLVLALAIGFTGPILSALRWREVLAITDHRISLKKSALIIMATWPLSILPGRLGDFARSYPIRREIPVSVAIGSILFEKVIDIGSLFFLSAVGFSVLGWHGYAFLALVVAMLVIPTLFISKRLITSLPQSVALNLNRVFAPYHSMGMLLNRHFLYATILSLGNWFTSILEVWILYRAFGADLPLVSVSAHLPLAILIGLLPISIAGIGTRDFALISFFLNRATAAQSLAVGLGYSFIGYFLFAIIGTPFFIREFRLSARD